MSSSVFDAMISTRALQNPASAESALRRELARGAAANPFLSEFYGPQGELAEPIFLRPEHIGVVYASLRARLSIGDTASLLVEGPEKAEEEDENALRAEVEISLARRGEDRLRLLRFESDQTGPVRLGTHIEDIDITVPYGHVEIGPGSDAVLIAPVNIQCAKLTLTTDNVTVESRPDSEAAAVLLEAETLDGTQMVSVPVLRGNVSLAPLRSASAAATSPSISIRRCHISTTAFSSAPVPMSGGSGWVSSR